MASKVNTLGGKTALVTGGGTRIGRALAVRLAREGCDVAVHYHSSRKGAEEVVGEIKHLGRNAWAFAADLARPDGPMQLAKQINEKLPRLDILINSASFWPAPETLSASHSLLKESIENWEVTFAVNTRAPFFLTQQLAPLIEQSDSGVIVNIVDQSISEPYLDRASHSLSKSALAAMTKLAAMELLGKIRVNGLELGAILPPPGMPEHEIAKREWGGVEAVEDALMFVLSNQFVNGEIIPVKGSRHLRDRGSLADL